MRNRNTFVVPDGAVLTDAHLRSLEGYTLYSVHGLGGASMLDVMEKVGTDHD